MDQGPRYRMNVVSNTQKSVILQGNDLPLDMQDKMIKVTQGLKYPSSLFQLAIVKYQPMLETIQHHYPIEDLNYLTRDDNLDPLEKHVNTRTCVETSNVLLAP